MSRPSKPTPSPAPAPAPLDYQIVDDDLDWVDDLDSEYSDEEFREDFCMDIDNAIAYLSFMKLRTEAGENPYVGMPSAAIAIADLIGELPPFSIVVGKNASDELLKFLKEDEVTSGDKEKAAEGAGGGKDSPAVGAEKKVEKDPSGSVKIKEEEGPSGGAEKAEKSGGGGRGAPTTPAGAGKDKGHKRSRSRSEKP